MAEKYDHASAALSNLRSQELSIIRLSEPISLSDSINGLTRDSDISAHAFESPSPASLALDLAHYKVFIDESTIDSVFNSGLQELFSKLRFSYLEQVTKEKFLRAIVGDPPEVIEHQENLELEAQLVNVKADLKAQKLEVEGMVDELEAKGRDLSQRYENVTLQSVQLSTLPSQIAELQETITTLDSQQNAQAVNPSLSLPLPATLDLLATKQAEVDELDQQLKSLQNTLPRKTRELERLGNELKPLEAQKTIAVTTAKEARKRREEGERGLGDDLELKGRWYRSVETGLKEMLGVEA